MTTLRRLLRACHFVVAGAVLFAAALADAGYPEGWPAGALVGAALAMLVLLPGEPRRWRGFNSIRRQPPAGPWGPRGDF
jgi:hypothetical protein